MNLSNLLHVALEPKQHGKSRDEWLALAAVWAVRAVEHVDRGEYPMALQAHRHLAECRINAAKMRQA